MDISPKKLSKWPKSIWKHAQHHWSSRKCKLKPLWDPISYPLWWLQFFFFSSTSLLLPPHLPPPSYTHAQSCNPMDCSLPGSSVPAIHQVRILEWVAISFSRGSSWPRDQTWVSCIAGRFFIIWATREAPFIYFILFIQTIYCMASNLLFQSTLCLVVVT